MGSCKPQGTFMKTTVLVFVGFAPILLFQLLGCATVNPQEWTAAQVKMTEMQRDLQQLKQENTTLKGVLADFEQQLKTLQTQQSSASTVKDAAVQNSPTKNQTEGKKATDVKRCAAITQKGTQCTRNATAGSDFCWQHAGSSKAAVKENAGVDNSQGKTIYTGPKGGQYYINKNGNKTYVRKKK